jgi:hypothetical protein
MASERGNIKHSDLKTPIRSVVEKFKAQGAGLALDGDLEVRGDLTVTVDLAVTGNIQAVDITATGDLIGTHTTLSDIGTNTHAQIDTALSELASHLSDSSDPHGATLTQTTANITTANITTANITNLPMLTIDSAALAVSQFQTIAHNLGARPNRVIVSMLCVTAELGYAVDDEVFISPNGYDSGSIDNRITVIADATNFYTITGTSIRQIARKDTGAIAIVVMAKWKFRIRYGL